MWEKIEPVVTFGQLVEKFPRIKNKSKETAKKILPLPASPELAALIAALMTDGHVEWAKADGRPRAKKIMLYSSEKPECEWFLSIVRQLFGVEGIVLAYTQNPAISRNSLTKHLSAMQLSQISLLLQGCLPETRQKKNSLFLIG